jgi:UDP-N-acetylglucosamine 3-dehydrogenase
MRVGIVGNNLYGQIFYRAFHGLENVEIVAMCPELGEQLEPFSTEHGIETYKDFHTMLEAVSLDIVILASVTSLHSIQAISAMVAGAHVLVDRPMALSLSECDQMIEQAQKSGKRLMIGHVLQYWPEYVVIREMVLNGELGRIHTGTGWRISGALNPAWQKRLLDPHNGLGCLEAHFHDIDFLNYLFGKPESVVAQGRKTSDGAWSQVHSQLRYQNGLRIAMEANYNVPRNYPLSMHLRMDGEKGTIVFNFQGALAAQSSAQRTLIQFANDSEPFVHNIESYDAYRSMTNHFLESISSGDPPPFGTPVQSRDALQVLHAISESAQSEMKITL